MKALNPALVLAALASLIVSSAAMAENIGKTTQALTENCSISLRVNHIQGGCGDGASDELMVSYATDVYAGKRYLVSVDVTGMGDYSETPQDNTLVAATSNGSYGSTDVTLTSWKAVPGEYKAFILVRNADTGALVCTNQSAVTF